jgi:hypothetical protein
LFLIRRLITRYDHARGHDGQTASVVMYSCELLVDGITVLLFAVATFRGIGQFASAV